MSDFVIKNGMLTEYNGPGGDIVIPEEVRQIGKGSFMQRNQVTHVTIPEGVTEIRDCAFFWCENLVQVCIPSSVTRIGAGAFHWCRKLASITLPDGITAIEDLTFLECKSLRRVVIPDSVTTISATAFDPGKNLRIHIRDLSLLPAKQRIYAALSFAEDGGEITDPRFESHGKYLKANSGKLMETAIKNRALLILLCREGWIKAKDMESYVDAVQKTGDAERIAMILEYQNSKLTKKQKENAAKQKEKQADAVVDRAIARMEQVGISGLNFVITGDVTTFQNRNELKAFIESQGGKLLSAMSAKTDYLIMNHSNANTEKKKKAAELGIDVITEAEFNRKAGRQFAIDKNGTLLKYVGEGGNVTIPKQVKSIGAWAFYNCGSVASVTIPNRVASIGEYAFLWCGNLTSVVIGNGVKSIGERAFEKCANLTSVILGSGVESIGDLAFVMCGNLTSITIPDCVTSISRNAFTACENLTIHGKAGSYAETYAKEKNIPFVADAV